MLLRAIALLLSSKGWVNLSWFIDTMLTISGRFFLGTLLLATIAIPSNGQDFCSAEPPSGVPVSSAGNYRCSFRNLWTPATHPNAFPADGSWSDQLYIVHSGTFALWQPGGYASGGVARIAKVCISMRICRTPQLIQYLISFLSIAK
jgi:hypothetical protein